MGSGCPVGGVGPDWIDRATALVEAGADALFIDAATGHTTRVLDVVSELRNMFTLPVVAGNVVTEQGAKDLVTAGANAVKVAPPRKFSASTPALLST